MCGEYLRGGLIGGGLAGSSPRVRGICGGFRGVSPPSRIIPACAGNIPNLMLGVRHPADHPRVCGEYDTCHDSWLGIPGSSPRVRGISLAPRMCGRGAADHPRVCGEYVSALEISDYGQGSSPRVRGIWTEAAVRSRQTRIIPACAGNIPDPGANRLSFQDHPRVCGEYVMLSRA